LHRARKMGESRRPSLSEQACAWCWTVICGKYANKKGKN